MARVRMPPTAAASTVASSTRWVSASSPSSESLVKALPISEATCAGTACYILASCVTYTLVQTDDGYFPRRTSMLRRVHEERAVGLLYGQRALCIGALAPLNYVG